MIITIKYKLLIVRIIHTAIWAFFNLVIFYFIYAVVNSKIDKWTWICLGIVILEGITLVVFKGICPITLKARRYSNSTKDNFDLFLPDWLAKYNKLIYTTVVIVAVILLVCHLKF